MPQDNNYKQWFRPVIRFTKKLFARMTPQLHPNKANEQILQSNYVSRDLSWFQFNYRVLDQAQNANRTVYERLKFLAITASNFDEFAMIRIGSLYNYLDYDKERIDYSGLREKPFKTALFNEAQNFFTAQNELYVKELAPLFGKNGFQIIGIDQLTETEQEKAALYFKKTIYPMLTPMMVDVYHTFPVVMNKALTFGVVTQNLADSKNPKRLSFVQIPLNLPRFLEIHRADTIAFVPIEEIIRWKIYKLYRNIEILSVNLLRVTRNGDISIEESDDVEADFVDEVRRKLSGRRTGRVVRVEVEDNYSSYMMKLLKQRWEIDYDNIFVSKSLLDFTALWQIVNHQEFKDKLPHLHSPVLPLSAGGKDFDRDLFDTLKHRDILMHHPYNSMEPVISLLEQAAEDPNVLSIKMTIYRLSKTSRITNALLKAAENGKHVAVLFEVKARFDEENNIREAQKLQKAGCFVIYGVGNYKTHTKMMLIVRKDEEVVTRYVHLSSGNYNESTAKMYTDVGLLSTNQIYANDVSAFFNAITGHSIPNIYKQIITAPRDMRLQLIELIRQEAENARNGLPSGIVIKINSLEDQASIDELYKASQAGVRIKLIIRGICCLRPLRVGLSENITVRSVVGEFLEHTRLYYFHNAGNPKVYGGSADMMNRSFDRRLESLFLIVDEKLKQEAINILAYNLRDNMNAYVMLEDGNYMKKPPREANEQPFDIHKEFYHVTEEIVMNAKLF